MIAHARDILVTGANGRLGRWLIAELAKDDRRLRAARRTRVDELPASVRTFAVGEIDGGTDWSEAVAGADAVVHCAALTHLPAEQAAGAAAQFDRANCDGSLALARQAAEAGVRRFVFISSATVNGRASGARPFRAGDRPNPQTAYSRSKQAAEEGLRAIGSETGLEIAIIRPPRIIWPELGGNLSLLQRLIEQGVPLPFGLIDFNRRDHVSPGSLTALVRACLDHPAAAGETFLVSDDEPLSTRELVVRLGRRGGRTPRLVPVPTGALRLTIALMPGRFLGKMTRAEMADELLGNLELDVAATRSTLGWSPSPSLL